MGVSLERLVGSTEIARKDGTVGGEEDGDGDEDFAVGS
jgi:hypothetical protein